MKRKDIFPIISIVIPSIIVFMLSSQGPIMKPYFTADVTNEDGNLTLLTIKNVGWAQAKNASAYIESDNVLQIKKNECFEGSFDTLPNTLYTIHFKRLSSGVDCKIHFSGLHQEDFTTIIVTADDAQGYQRNQYDIIYHALLASQASLIAIVVSIVVGVLTTIGTLKNISKERKMNKIISDKIMELDRQIKNLDDGIGYAMYRLDKSGTTERVAELNEIVRSYEEQKKILINERDKLTMDMMATEEDTRETLGEFFAKWGKLEQELKRIGKTYNIDPNPETFTVLVLQKLPDKLKQTSITGDVITLRFVRNGLVHGSLTLNKKDLEKYIVKIDSILSELEKVK